MSTAGPGFDAARLVPACMELLAELAALAPPRPPGRVRGVDAQGVAMLREVMSRALVQFHRENGILPRLQSPREFCEKVFVAKFLLPFALPTLADKLRLKEVARARFGPDVAGEVLWASGAVEGLDAAIRALPAGRYFLKASHGSGMNLRFHLGGRDRTAVIARVSAEAEAWLRTRWGLHWGEFHYSTFPPRIFIEPAHGATEPLDYRVYVMHGAVRMVAVNSGSHSRREQREGYFDEALRDLPLRTTLPGFEGGAPPPPRPGEMFAMAREVQRLSGMSMARVDFLWTPDAGLRLSEATLTPGNGLLRYRPLDFNTRMGDWWDLEPELGFR